MPRIVIIDKRDGDRTVKVVSDSHAKDPRPKRVMTESYTDTRTVNLYFEDGEVPDWVESYTSYGSGYSGKITTKERAWRARSVSVYWTRREGGDWHGGTATLRSVNVKANGEMGQREDRRSVYSWDQKKFSRELEAIFASTEGYHPGTGKHPFLAEAEEV